MRAVAAVKTITLSVGLGVTALPSAGMAAALAPHRAIYDLSLEWASKQSGIEGIDGRFVYEFTGGLCSGYITNMRMVTDILKEFETVNSDQSSSSFEDLGAGTFSFSSKVFSNADLQSERKGEAVRQSDKAIDVTVQDGDGATLPEAEFPTEYMEGIIRAAANGKSVYQARTFDGSGNEIMLAVTMIGHAVDVPKAADLKTVSAPRERAWPVTTAYYPTGAATSDEMPSYTMSMLLGEDGISHDLLMDFGDFRISAEMTALDLLQPVACTAKKDG
ncbi:EipB family protein [Martelella alba]|nr:DUF1849 family protein [Martelella alba]